ncbi:MAG: hypothetical protein J6W24_05265 [Prevotella sp.]|nr:hypothetical protein [Prevotella sp.]
MKKLITLSLLAIAVGMTASISADEKPCCMEAKPCCQDTASCCSDADTLDVPLHMETNGNPQLL